MNYLSDHLALDKYPEYKAGTQTGQRRGQNLLSCEALSQEKCPLHVLPQCTVTYYH